MKGGGSTDDARADATVLGRERTGRVLGSERGEMDFNSGTSFLSEAGRTLAASLDYETALKQVARLAVPTLADWCVIDIVEEDSGELRRLAVSHADPERVELALELSRRYPPRPDQPIGPRQVARTGEVELVSEIGDALLESIAQDEEHLALLRGIGFTSYMCVPLRTRGKVLGAITCAAAESGRRFGTRDLAVLEDLARGAAVAIDNALLFHEAEEARASAEEALSQLGSLFSSAPVGLALWDRELRYVRVNDALASMNGVAAEEHMGRTPTEVLGALGEEIEREFRKVLETQRAIPNLELTGHTPAASGDERHWLVTYYPVLSGSGEVLGVGGVVTEVTERRRAEDALRRGQSLFQLLVEGVKDFAIYMLDPEGRVVSWNPGAEHIKGYSREEILGQHFSLFYTKEAIDRGEPEALLQVAAEQGRCAQERWGVRKDGSRFWVSTVVTALRDESGRLSGFAKLTRDATEHKAMEDHLRQQALHDVLTGLANRTLLRDRIQQAFRRRDRRDERLAVLFIDLDDFKRVNDTMGHDAGDRLLVEVAARLRECIRPSDTAARLGGDEFGVLLEDLHDPSDAARVAERILEVLQPPFVLAKTEVTVSASIGVVATPKGQSADEAMRNADLAMYAAKQEGRSRFALFEPRMHTAAVERLQLEEELRRALGAGEFDLHYQPIVDLRTGRIVGVEALLRWNHPKRGVLSPLAFIGVAEDTGLIVPIGRWVLDEACRRARLLREEDPTGPPLSMSVNVSVRQFADPALIDDVKHALAGSGVDAEGLILEVPEAALLQEEEGSARLCRLKDLGVRVALEAFGTGYSSLTQLRDLPVDVLSFDKSFIEGLKGGSSDWEFAGSILRMCQALELDTLAEGIERSEQLAKLRDLGCDEGQGYYLSHPLDLDQTLELIRSSE